MLLSFQIRCLHKSKWAGTENRARGQITLGKVGVGAQSIAIWSDHRDTMATAPGKGRTGDARQRCGSMLAISMAVLRAPAKAVVGGRRPWTRRRSPSPWASRWCGRQWWGKEESWRAAVLRRICERAGSVTCDPCGYRWGAANFAGTSTVLGQRMSDSRNQWTNRDRGSGLREPQIRSLGSDLPSLTALLPAMMTLTFFPLTLTHVENRSKRRRSLSLTALASCPRWKS